MVEEPMKAGGRVFGWVGVGAAGVLGCDGRAGGGEGREMACGERTVSSKSAGRDVVRDGKGGGKEARIVERS